MARSSLFTLLSLFVLGFALSSCDGDEVDITNHQIDPPMIEVEAGTIDYTQDGEPNMEAGLGFVCRTDSISPGMFAHSYTVTNIDVSSLSDTNFIVPIAEGDIIIGGYKFDAPDIDGTYLFLMVDHGDGTLAVARCYDCPITMVEDDGALTGTFSGTLVTTAPDSVFHVTDGTFEVPLIELDCN